MCGIAGFLRRVGQSGTESMRTAVVAMATTISSRGPDDAGSWVDPSAGVAFGHRRLSIIDLSSAGRQPMHSASQRYVLTFNGEIYNHLDIRAELQASGAAPAWRGRSDTETLLAAFEHWGLEAALRRAVGMFAIALWDTSDRKLYLVRDRFGEKPLYYGWVGSGGDRAFAFGSELKALRAYPGFANSVNRDALELFLRHCTVPAPYCIYEDLFKLSPGYILTLDADDSNLETVRLEPYWRLANVARHGLAEPLKDEDEAVSALEAALREAVRAQAIADVPLGAFLSGGVDSSTIVALMQAQSSRSVQTFTVGFEEAGFDESAHAAAVARHLGTDHHELRVTAADALSIIPDLAGLYDEPFADSSQIPTHLICKLARRYVTVALSGDAGDELFGGYNRYLWGQRIWAPYARMPRPLRRGLGVAIRALPAPAWDAIGRTLLGAKGVVRLGDKAHRLARRLQSVDSLDQLYRSLVTEWPEDAKVALGANGARTLLDDSSLVADMPQAEHRMMLWDSLTYLPDDILTKVDRAAMGVSLETRVPFLDHRVAELAWRLPLHMKIRDGQGKWAVRQVLYKYVPRELIDRPKAGFAIPIGEWLRGPLRDWAEALLETSRLRQEGFFDPAPIRETWAQHLSGRYDWTSRIWNVLMFQAWLQADQTPVSRLPDVRQPAANSY